MKIAVTGATGFVGTHLSRFLTKRGDTIVPLGRRDFSSDIQHLVDKLEGCDAVINLAGAPIGVRWTRKHKQEIYDSRIRVTRQLVTAVSQLVTKPQVFISTSAVGYYPSTGTHTESSEPDSTSFLAKVAKDWEQEARNLPPEIRLVILRFAVVLGKDGGVLARLTSQFRNHLGVLFGNGRQTFGWIHIDDLLAIFGWVLDNPDMQGVYNCIAPGITTMENFITELGSHYHAYLHLQLPPFLLRLLFLDGASFLLEGQYVIPERLLNAGFEFRYPLLREALDDLCSTDSPS